MAGLDSALNLQGPTSKAMSILEFIAVQDN
jgi:hypothetical protein